MDDLRPEFGTASSDFPCYLEVGNRAGARRAYNKMLTQVKLAYEKRSGKGSW